MPPSGARTFRLFKGEKEGGFFMCHSTHPVINVSPDADFCHPIGDTAFVL